MIGPGMNSQVGKNSETHAVDDDAGLQGERLRKLQQVSKARDRELLTQLEGALRSSMSGKGFDGPKGDRYHDACDKLGREYNIIAMKYLQSGANAVALDLLRGAESVITEAGPCHRLDSLKALTCNNLGCYFRREGNDSCVIENRSP
jgi:hypothetical protein